MARAGAGNAPSSFKADRLIQEIHQELRGAQIHVLESSKVTLKSQLLIYSFQDFFFFFLMWTILKAFAEFL